MASVSFKITNSSKFQGQGLEFVSGTNDGSFNPPYKEGQIIFVEGQGKIYLDFHHFRQCYTPDIPQVSNDGIRYKGISSTNPLTEGATLNGVPFTPQAGDLVVYGAKEFLYRYGDNGQLGWFEMGDEDKTNEIMWEVDD